MASFLGRHGEKQGVLPAFGVIQTARAGQLPVDTRGKITATLGLQFHSGTVPCPAFAGKELQSRGTWFGHPWSTPSPPHRD
ncbi:MAG: hypothetical protein EXQ58_10535 [Acidobacteria bacterium]|nr:hypothetical protein [Acidobacteriota bacterium]